MLAQEKATGCPDCPPNHTQVDAGSLSRALRDAGFDVRTVAERPSLRTLRGNRICA